MTVQQPGRAFPLKGAERSWSFIYKRGFDYMTQSGVTGHIFLGGGFANADNKGLDDFGNPSDSGQNILAIAHLGGILPAIFGDKNWGLDDPNEARVKSTWTGTLGFSADGLPWVGEIAKEIAGRDGRSEGSEWVAAGFCGQGMVYCWRSGQALAEMILGQDVSEWFPASLRVSSERLSNSNPAEAVRPLL